MFKVLRCLVNNLNIWKYTKNISNVRMKRIYDEFEDKEACCLTSKEGNFEAIKELQTDRRVKNLKLFLSNYGKLKAKRFIFFTCPALLATSSLATAVIPKVKVEKELSTYRVEHTLYNSSLGEAKFEKKIAITGTLFDYDAVDESVSFISNTPSNYVPSDTVDLKLYTDMNYVQAKFNVHKDEITFDNCYYGYEYFDFSDYDGVEFYSSEENYDVLLEKLKRIIVEKNDEYPVYVAQIKDELSKIDDAELKTIIIDITKYIKTGDEKFLFYIETEETGFILLILLIISVVITGFMFFNDKKRLSSIVSVCGFKYFFDVADFKKEFLEEEYNRIMALWEEINENIVDEDQGKLLTKYEKILIKKENEGFRH